MKEKILVVSWSVYPSRTGSAVLVDNIASAFSDSEMVLVGEGKDVPPRDKPKDHPKIHYLDPDIRLFGRGHKYLRWFNFNKSVRQIETLAKEENCTSILAIFPDEFYMNVAYKVSKKLNLSFYTWFHNTYLENRKGLLKMLAKRLQPHFFDHARINFVMSEGMLEFYNQKYPDYHFRALEHGFEIPNVTYAPSPPPNGKIKFMYSGNINEACLDATLRLFDVIRKNPDYELHIYGNENSVKYYNINTDRFVMHGFVPWENFVNSLKDYDIMLLPHGLDGTRTEIEYQTMFPTRTIPLLYSNRPILAHTPNDVFFTNFLRQNDCAEIVDEKDENAINAAIQRLLTDEKRREHIIKNAIKTAQIFDLKRITQELKTSLK